MNTNIAPKQIGRMEYCQPRHSQRGNCELLPSSSPRFAGQSFSDEELLVLYRSTGNDQAFELLVNRYERPLILYLCRIVHSEDNAEDIAQQTFLRVCQKAEMFDCQQSFRPWLYRIAFNLAMDYYRQQKQTPQVSLDASNAQQDGDSLSDNLSAEEKTAPESLIASEEAEQVRDAIDQLPNVFKTVLLLVYFDGMKYEDAAAELNIPIGTLKFRIHSAIEKLGWIVR